MIRCGTIAILVTSLGVVSGQEAVKERLEAAVKQSPRDAAALAAYAQYLDAHRDPQARKVYESLYGVTAGAKRLEVARRLAVLDLLAGDRASAAKRIEAYRAAGGADLTTPAEMQTGAETGMIEIPGPLRSFNRMAALSPDLPAEDLIGALARNVITNGYQATSGSETLEPTEYLKLVFRYLGQAREIEKLTDANKVLKLESCDSAQTGQLLKVLGLRMRGGCGSEVVLETVNATRAFLTMDSGFPLAELEQALRTNQPFSYDFKPTKVPVLYTPEYWLSAREKPSSEFVDAFLGDPSLCRLYLGLSKIDQDTANELRRALPVARIRAFAHVFDFFGGMFRIRDGKAVVPGAPRSTAAWTDLVGVSPDQGAEFLGTLAARDDGWMASYFDTLSRVHSPTLEYLTDPARMKRFYSALRGRITSPGPARPVFRANTDLMLLATRMRIGQDGRPLIPGGVETWKTLFALHPNGKYDGKLTKLSTSWKEPDDVVEALFALSRKAVENEPLKMYLALTDLERARTKPLETATVVRLLKDYRFYSPQYTIFTETPTISDATILAYLDAAAYISDVNDNGIKADGAGTMQALAGLWQVLVRHKIVPAKDADKLLADLVTPFPKLKAPKELFDAGRGGVGLLLQAAGSPAATNPQDRMMELMAGTASTPDGETLAQVVGDMNKVFEAQRLVSLKTLFDLSDHLDAVAKGEKLNTALVNRLSARVSDLNLPRAAMSAQEKNASSFGFWTEKHIEAERKLNFRSVVDRAVTSPDKLRDARGLLVPLLRDTLVGFLYAHYAPPGAQVLHTNPLFTRSHDFIGIQGTRQTWRTTEVLGSGWPSSAGGRLVGSLATLPYALAEAEQNFLIPTREQALIWGDLVPQMLVSAKVTRWWNVTPEQLRYISLHMRLAETLLAESAMSAPLRAKTMELLSRQADPYRVKRVGNQIAAGDVPGAMRLVTPAEMYNLAAGAVAEKLEVSGETAEEIRKMAAAFPAKLSPAAISEAFGTPKPTLANSLKPELLNLRLFPTLMGYSSRLMAESWESNNLYYAALAHELNMAPSQLNVLIPDWTRRGIEQIFATHLEDWPALLYSIRVTGDKIRAAEQRTRGSERAAVD